MAASRIAAFTVALAMFLPSAGMGDEAREKERAKLLEQMGTIAQETKVSFAEGSGEPLLVDKPVFRYDDQPRRLLDATVWAWTYEGRPIAFQKIEAMDGEPAQWQYCFSSLAEDRLKAQWTGGRNYQSTEAGVAYRPVPDSPAVAPPAPERRRQLRELAHSFAARIQPDSRSNDTQEMRLLTTPLFEFDDETSKLLQGAVFGYSTNGTNPDLVVAFEARPLQDKAAWHYAPARMTIGGITLRHGDKPVWECPPAEPGQNVFPTWTYFQTSRMKVEGDS